MKYFYYILILIFLTSCSSLSNKQITQGVDKYYSDFISSCYKKKPLKVKDKSTKSKGYSYLVKCSATSVGNHRKGYSFLSAEQSWLFAGRKKEYVDSKNIFKDKAKADFGPWERLNFDFNDYETRRLFILADGISTLYFRLYRTATADIIHKVTLKLYIKDKNSYSIPIRLRSKEEIYNSNTNLTAFGKKWLKDNYSRQRRAEAVFDKAKNASRRARSMPSNMTYDANGNPEWGAYRAEKRAERFAEQRKLKKVMNTLSNPNSHIYKNNRMSDKNLAKNYKPKSNFERTGTKYQEFKKTTNSYQRSKTQRKAGKRASKKQFDQVASLKSRCLSNPKSRWINGGCVSYHEFTNDRNCSDTSGKGCKSGERISKRSQDSGAYKKTSVSASMRTSVDKVENREGATKKGFVSDGRTKMFVSEPHMYRGRESARDLAQTSIENLGVAYCDSGLKTKIEWVDNGCDQSKDKKQYKCWQRALIHCSSNFCEKSFCGTAGK